MTTRTIEQKANRSLRTARNIGIKLPEPRTYKEQRIASDNKEISAFLFKALALMAFYIVGMLFIAEATLNTDDATLASASINKIEQVIR